LKRIPLVLGVPLGGLDLRLYLHHLAEGGSGTGGAAMPPGVARIARSKACRSAVKFNDALTGDDCSTLIKRLALTQMPFACAHGRPTTAPLVDLGALAAVLRASRVRRKPEDSRAAGRLTVGRMSKLVGAETTG
jgi:DNA mismatch repair ATPase MutL